MQINIKIVTFQLSKKLFVTISMSLTKIAALASVVRLPVSDVKVDNSVAGNDDRRPGA